MTQNEHTLVAVIVSCALHQIVWHMFLKHHQITKKNIEEWSDIFGKYF